MAWLRTNATDSLQGTQKEKAMRIAIIGAGNVGGLQEARLLDSFALTWIHLAVFQKLGTNFAFRLMKR